MLSSVNGEPAWEAPWVTSLLRDVLLEEAFIPVWRYATEYQPCEESAKEARDLNTFGSSTWPSAVARSGKDSKNLAVKWGGSSC